MDFDATCRLIGLNVDPITAEACRYLEGWGHRFAVDFGIENAVSKAGACLMRRNPIVPTPRGRQFLAPSVSGVQWDHDDREWLRSMERAFAETANGGIQGAD